MKEQQTPPTQSELLAEWKDAKGKTRAAPLTIAGDRIAVQAGTYMAKYRDGSGIVQDVATGCVRRARDEPKSMSVEGLSDNTLANQG